MRGLGMTAVVLGATLMLAACGETVQQRSATGGLGGAAVGALVGGPMGALVGGAAGAGTGAVLDQGVDRTVREAVTDEP